MKLTIWTGIVLAAALIAARASALETGIIRGHVTIASSGAPAAGAAVIVEGTALKTKTDNTGAYTIAGVPIGTYIVRAELNGSAGIQRVSIRSGQTTTA